MADPTQIAQLICANNGAVLSQIIGWGLGAIGGASLLANFRGKIPAPVMSVVDAVALNWVKSETAPKDKP